MNITHILKEKVIYIFIGIALCLQIFSPHLHAQTVAEDESTVFATSQSMKSFSSGFFNFQSETGSIPSVANLNKSVNDDYISVLSSTISPIFQDTETVTYQSEASQTNGTNVLIKGPARFYPNPFQQKTGSKLVYFLNDNANIEIQIYDMLANRLFKQTYPKGSDGGKMGYNILKFDFDTLSQFKISAGVYFYILLNDGKLLKKGKMAIIP